MKFGTVISILFKMNCNNSEEPLTSSSLLFISSKCQFAQTNEIFVILSCSSFLVLEINEDGEHSKYYII